MTSRALALITVAAVLAVLFLTGSSMTLLAANGTCATAPASAPSGDQPTVRWDDEQTANARTIITVGARKRVPARGWTIALATAMQESGLRNLPGGDRDSIGLFQQRPSQGWGTPAQLRDPTYAATRFYTKLTTIDGWQSMPLTRAAQAAQRSAYPDAYAKWETPAALLTQQQQLALTATPATDLHACGNRCPDAATERTGTADRTSPSAAPVGVWVAPVNAPIVSGFRSAQRPGHDGVDLGARRGTPICAATTGTVTVVRCNIRPASHGCDRDGSEATPGCGWYVQIRHGDGVLTRYCHMLRRPQVTIGQHVVTGQVLGHVGSSGHSSGPHLHFQVHVNNDPTESGAIDPVSFMATRARLGRS